MKSNLANRKITHLALATLSLLALASCASGKDGKDGSDGANGADGATWYYGTETNQSQGKTGDFFYDTDDSAIYVKTEEGWKELGSIKGQDGKDGKDGQNGSDGVNGTNGTNGKDGATWLSGNAITGEGEAIEASINGAKVGDFYLNIETGNVYQCVSENTWKYLMCLKSGGQGANQKQEWNEDRCLKILSIGNSFSADSQQWLYQIAKSIGAKRVVLGNLYIGGCTLETHLSNATNDTAAYTYYTNEDGAWVTHENYQIDTAVTSENWDYITFQQASGYSGIASTYNDLDSLIDIVEPLCPKAKLVWNMTWAYQSTSGHSDFAKYNNNQATMYSSIVEAVQSKIVTDSHIDRIIPVGTAIQNARTSYLGDNLTRDGFHLTYGVGRYIAGLCFAYSTTGLPISSIEYTAEGVNEGEKLVAIESVKNAFANPYQVTSSVYKEDPIAIDTDKYETLSIIWSKSGFYNSNDDQNLKTGESNSKYFWATQLFTKDTLPIGSIIKIGTGWQYRPEGWVNGASSGVRPDSVSTSQVEINDAWWGSYTQRAFNVSKQGSTTDLSSLTEDDLNQAFKIYVPKATTVTKI